MKWAKVRLIWFQYFFQCTSHTWSPYLLHTVWTSTISPRRQHVLNWYVIAINHFSQSDASKCPILNSKRCGLLNCRRHHWRTYIAAKLSYVKRQLQRLTDTMFNNLWCEYLTQYIRNEVFFRGSLYRASVTLITSIRSNGRANYW